MSRPTDWSPLAGSDPIGGDVGAVHEEATYYSSLADEISAQVARLRRIAAEGDQVGRTADKLRQSASDTADKLQKTHGRVAAVGEALTSWIPSLETAQRDTLSALTRAQEAAASQHANTATPGAPAPTTDAERTADQARQNRYDAAGTDLSAARHDFDRAVSTRDSDASRVAGKIRDALHDGLGDGFWDHVSHWVSQHLEAIKVVTEVLSWVATALAVVALFIPGLNLIVLAAMALVLAGHFLLAATGNGSWLDVGLDIVGLLTFHLGNVAEAGLKATAEQATARTLDVAGERAATGVTTSRALLRGEMETRTAGVLGKLAHPLEALSLRTGLFDLGTSFSAGMERLGARAAVRTALREAPEASRIRTAASVLGRGGKEVVEARSTMSVLSRFAGDDAQLAALSARFGGQSTEHTVAYAAGTGLDLARHGLDRSDIPWVQDHLLPGYGPWMRFKEHFVAPIPGLTPAPGGEG